MMTEILALEEVGLPQIKCKEKQGGRNPPKEGICVSFNYSFSSFDLQTLIQLYSVFVT